MSRKERELSLCGAFKMRGTIAEGGKGQIQLCLFLLKTRQEAKASTYETRLILSEKKGKVLSVTNT